MIDPQREPTPEAEAAHPDPRDKDRTALRDAFQQIVRAEYGEAIADEVMGVFDAALGATPYPVLTWAQRHGWPDGSIRDEWNPSEREAAHPTHHWNDPDGDGHNCADCASDSMWKCDAAAHVPGHARITDPTCPACIERHVAAILDSIPLPTPKAQAGPDHNTYRDRDRVR